MFLLRVVGLFLLSIAVIANAQARKDGRIKLQVQDQSGAFVADASVRIDPSESSEFRVFKVDSKGQADFDLPAGLHVIRVSSPGFKITSIKVDVGEGKSQVIRATLVIAFHEGPVLVRFTPTPLPLFRPQPGLLELKPLQTVPLPSRKLKSHYFWH